MLAEAGEVVVSDYPDTALLDNIQRNIDTNVKTSQKAIVSVEGHVWGMLDDAFGAAKAGHFSRILVADCLWMPEQHRNLASSIAHFLSPKPDARAYVVAGFHSGRERMAPFFDVVGDEELIVTAIYEVDVNGQTREWKQDRGEENVFERKRWLAVAELSHLALTTN